MDDGGYIWWKLDRSFLIPKIYYKIAISSPIFIDDPKSYIYLVILSTIRKKMIAK
jgi:hypothetical protein